MNRIRSDLNRRRFLFALGAGSAATAAGIAARNVTQAPQDTGEAQQPRSKGYQETEHVRNYYRTTRV